MACTSPTSSYFKNQAFLWIPSKTKGGPLVFRQYECEENEWETERQPELKYSKESLFSPANNLGFKCQKYTMQGFIDNQRLGKAKQNKRPQTTN